MVRRRLSLLAFVGLGLVVAAALVIVVAPRASSSPDGLERVAAEKGIDSEVREHTLGASPFADYGVEGVDDAGLGTVVAGLLGVASTFVICIAAVWVIRRRRNPPPSSAVPLRPSSPPGA